MSFGLVLHTERFLLRPLVEEDVGETYLSWMTEPKIVGNLMAQRHPQTLETIRDFVASHDNRHRFLFGIFDKRAASPVHIGNMSVSHYPEDDRASVGVIVGDFDYWGKGVVLEARGRVLDFLFDELQVEKVHAGCFGSNVQALFNFKKQGWTREGLRRRHYKFEGKYFDEVLFCLFKEDWRARRGQSGMPASSLTALNRDDG
jgi:RimJ/RimL family protein N-acetyltransferase